MLLTVMPVQAVKDDVVRVRVVIFMLQKLRYLQ